MVQNVCFSLSYRLNTVIFSLQTFKQSQVLLDPKVFKVLRVPQGYKVLRVLPGHLVLLVQQDPPEHQVLPDLPEPLVPLEIPAHQDLRDVVAYVVFLDPLDLLVLGEQHQWFSRGSQIKDLKSLCKGDHP